MNAAMSMHATIMHFASCFPDWNSLDSVRRAHSDLEAAALIFFALLVVCEALAHLSDDKKAERRFDKIGIVFFALAVLAEIAAYPYGQRNDTLSDQAMASLQTSARDANDRATAAQNRADAAENHAAEVQESVAPRRLTGKQASVIAARLLRFSGQPVVAFSHTFDVESAVLAAEILATLKSAKWDMNSTVGVSGPVFQWVQAPSVPVTGIFIEAATDKRSQLAARALSQELSSNGFSCRIRKKGLIGIWKKPPVVLIDVEPRPEGPQGEAKLRAEVNKKQASSNHTANP